jgi:hypothetical protein
MLSSPAFESLREWTDTSGRSRVLEARTTELLSREVTT